MTEPINLAARRAAKRAIEDDLRYIWVCECGCMSFSLMLDGTAECQSCEGTPQNAGGGWVTDREDPPVNNPPKGPVFDLIRLLED